MKVSTPNLEYLLIMTRCSCNSMGWTQKALVFELHVCPFLIRNLSRMIDPDEWALVLHAVLFLYLECCMTLHICLCPLGKIGIINILNIRYITLTLYLPNFLNGIIHLPFLELSNTKMRTWKLVSQQYWAWTDRLAWLYTDSKD